MIERELARLRCGDEEMVSLLMLVVLVCPLLQHCKNVIRASDLARFSSVWIRSCTSTRCELGGKAYLQPFFDTTRHQSGKGSKASNTLPSESSSVQSRVVVSGANFQFPSCRLIQ